MTATTWQREDAPDDYPEVEVSTAAAPFLPTAWARVESYIALRTAERIVTWVAEGCGEWRPPLRPATIVAIEVWRGEAWEVTSLGTSPLGGYMLPGAGPYRFTGIAGDGNADPPALLVEAVRRLAEFMAATDGNDGAGLRSENIPEIWSGEFDRSAKARALQDSGAADLLRTFRRA